MLVSQDKLSTPLLGFNVIQEIIRGNSNQSDNISFVDLLTETLKVQKCNVESLISAVLTKSTENKQKSHVIKVGKKGLTVFTNQICMAKCQLKSFPAGGEMLFEPAMKTNLPDGLELFQALIDVPPGATKIVKIPIQPNMTFSSIQKLC